jgi:hypothetical protein
VINDLMKLKLRKWSQIEKDRKDWNYLVQKTIKNEVISVIRRRRRRRRRRRKGN